MVRRPALDPHREEVVYILMRQVPLKLMFKIVISTILLERYPSLCVSYCRPQARTLVSHFLERMDWIYCLQKARGNSDYRKLN
jgi:hypothetical protein